MEMLIWIGAAISVTGLGGLVYCILRVLKAKRAGLDDEALRAAVAKVVFLSVIGLMMVILGIFLG